VTSPLQMNCRELVEERGQMCIDDQGRTKRASFSAKPFSGRDQRRKDGVSRRVKSGLRGKKARHVRLNSMKKHKVDQT
jgi:hypothetical protein